MKKILLIIAIAFTGALKAQQMTQLRPLDKSDYDVQSNIEGKSQSTKVWILFIPIGGKSQKAMEDQAFSRAIEKNHCDGILQPKYQKRRILIPLIIVTVSYRKVVVTGSGYKIKNK